MPALANDRFERDWEDRDVAVNDESPRDRDREFPDQVGDESEETGFEEVTVYADPVSDLPGHFVSEFQARDAGAYLATVEVTDVMCGGPEGAFTLTIENGVAPFNINWSSVFPTPPNISKIQTEILLKFKRIS